LFYFQVSDACAKAVYSLLLLLLPVDTNAGSWALSRALLKKICESRVRKIDTCPNDCIAYIDCKHPKLAHYKHAHRRCCPVCGADRWVVLPDGTKRTAKEVYHLPIGPWLHDLFRDEEMAPYLDSETSEQPPGHVSKSRGWHEKMTSNPRMNTDTRNQGMVGMSDGIPLFRDKHSRSVTPLLFRSANLPDHLSMKFRNTHLGGLVPNHFWTIGESSQTFERVERKPSHLCAIMHAIVDDLLMWEEGELVEDHSRHPDDPNRFFQLRALLLYWCGDYPGQGEASGFSHAPMSSKACHWCEDRGNFSKAINRQKYGGYFRSHKYLQYTSIIAVSLNNASIMLLFVPA
jgi:hypothetical protein